MYTYVHSRDSYLECSKYESHIMDTCSRVLTISSGENIVAVKPAASEPAAISLAIGHGSPLYCAAAVIRTCVE